MGYLYVLGSVFTNQVRIEQKSEEKTQKEGLDPCGFGKADRNLEELTTSLDQHSRIPVIFLPERYIYHSCSRP